jgi:hypothetical protein
VHAGQRPRRAADVLDRVLENDDVPVRNSAFVATQIAVSSGDRGYREEGYEQYERESSTHRFSPFSGATTERAGYQKSARAEVNAMQRLAC